MMRFKVDENLPVEVATVLLTAGHDAMTVIGQQMSGRPDADLILACQREDRIVVTLDLDFADIRAYPPADYPGIIVLRLARLDRNRILSCLERLVVALQQESPIANSGSLMKRRFAYENSAAYADMESTAASECPPLRC